jgi:hypothetical protein
MFSWFVKQVKWQYILARGSLNLAQRNSTLALLKSIQAFLYFPGPSLKYEEIYFLF